jgi:Do/DeqQ family serine protease
MMDPFFRRFFNIPEQPIEPRRSAGSGVIVDAEKGYVLTNHHVIDEADSVTVTLKDRRSFKAKVIGSDAGTDIALLQIEPERLTALTLGDSDSLAVGDFVVAIGNPFGLGQTVTSGIVSALGRSGLNIEGYEDFIQTDASINPGNSGGALVNSKGELIGINTAIIGPAGGNVGIGFAVPSNMARAVMDQLIDYGEVRRGRLGVSVQNLTPALAEALDVRSPRGAVVTQVESGSPAAQAGLRPGDVIVEINRQPIDDATDLRNLVGMSEIGGGLNIIFYREGQERRLSTQVGRIEASP